MNPLRKLLFLFRKPQKPTPSTRPDALLSSIRKPQKSTPSTRPDALLSSILKDIPVEILLHIMGFLPLESAVIFSLTCLQLKEKLGSEYFSRIASSNEHTLPLLNLIVLDLPNCVACSACNRLHNMENLLRYSCITYSAGNTTRQYDWLRFPACVSEDRKRSSNIVSSYFGSTAVKMALKRAHQNAACTELLTMMSGPSVRMTNWGKYVRQFREECRIVQGNLMHRLQSVFISDGCEKNTAFRSPLPPTEKICRHTRLSPRSFLDAVGFGVMRCEKCPTEYRIDIVYCEGLGWGRCFTRWKDLGSELEGWSRHLPPKERTQMRRWRALLEGEVSAKTDMISQDEMEVLPKAGELCCAFEGSKDYKFDSLLTPENKAKFLQFRELYCRKKKQTLDGCKACLGFTRDGCPILGLDNGAKTNDLEEATDDSSVSPKLSKLHHFWQAVFKRNPWTFAGDGGGGDGGDGGGGRGGRGGGGRGGTPGNCQPILSKAKGAAKSAAKTVKMVATVTIKIL
ncbi:hypothetical protein EAF00_008941 [Botryotinia globosa]|nr:hypothetical protein EAF00_008941 [Botryotinia globosa]